MTLPEGFVKSLESLGADAGGLADALADTAPALSVRVNTGKGIVVPSSATRVPWCDSGFYLDERPVFAADPAWHQGLYYVQDASSMAAGTVAAALARQYLADGPLVVLDACAAPGGKTIGYLEALPEGTMVAANEFDRQRANILAENITRYGSPYAVVTNADARRFGAMGELFDIVAADMPCSGEGMMRKDETAREQWSPGLVQACADLQYEIALALWDALKPGGIFIYSTCTFNIVENENNIRRLAETSGAEIIDIPLSGHGMTEGVGMSEARRFYPSRVRGEGLFIAALRKPDGVARTRRLGAPRGDRSFPHLLAEPEKYTYINKGTEIVALPSLHAALMAELSAKFRTLYAGVPLALCKGRDLIPVHELALSACLDSDAYPADELDYRAALAYLAGEAPAAPGLPKGIYAPAWKSRPLGWAKNIGNRANNLMPAHMRLRLNRDSLVTPPSIISL